ncbi:MAG: N-acetyltransferase [candidate division Zixibacteria bacterium]|nr:N-acetyltransferase [candidate division Zixibacteria bacterium]
MQYRLEPMMPDARTAVIDIFNYFVENSFAAYFGVKVNYRLFDRFLMMIGDYPSLVVKTETGEIVGFGFIHPYHPADSFGRTAEVTYFILPDHTGKGLGKQMLDHFEAEARKRGIEIFLASISSLNDGSIRFHRQRGFIECGRFKRIGCKKGLDFDMVWMQKTL